LSVESFGSSTEQRPALDHVDVDVQFSEFQLARERLPGYGTVDQHDMGSGGKQSSASATGSVQVGVMLDGNFDSNGQYLGGGTYAYPGLLSFDTRTQTLTATLGQALTGCSLVNMVVTCTGLTTQQIQLMLNTTAAHSFQFILPNVGVAPNSAPHRIDIVAQVSSSTLSSGLGSALASACYGAGTVTVDAVRLGNGFNCSSSSCSTT